MASVVSLVFWVFGSLGRVFEVCFLVFAIMVRVGLGFVGVVKGEFGDEIVWMGFKFSDMCF